MNSTVPTREIAPGVEMPAISLGHPDDGSPTIVAASDWFNLGGRGIDTAYSYHNQDQIGAAIRAYIAKGGKRNDIFVTTKINPARYGDCSEQSAKFSIIEDLKELGLPSVDLMLLALPCPDKDGNQAVWKALMEAKKKGLTRAIGVSNFRMVDIDSMLEAGGDYPAINQCLMSVDHHDDPMISYCDLHNITYEAYSPLRHVDLDDKRIQSIAAAHNVSSAQVCLRWIAQQGVQIATSPGSSKEYALEDLTIFDFTLTGTEMKELSKIAPPRPPPPPASV